MIDLKDHTTKPPDDAKKKPSKKRLKKVRKELYQLQKKFYADSSYSILVVVQGQHTAGKNGSVRKAYRRMNPMGVEVVSFKEPTDEEKSHDFLWRVYPHFPKKGMIKVFNRSYYEDILVPHVKGELTGEMLQHRINIINQVEQHLLINKTIIIKIYLHISPEEQKDRIEERKEKPKKQWKYKPKDEKAPSQYDDYISAYDTVLNSCNHIPWHIVPSDKRWHRDLQVGELLLQEMENLDLEFPTPEALK